MRFAFFTIYHPRFFVVVVVVVVVVVGVVVCCVCCVCAAACGHCTLNFYSTAIKARGRNKRDGGGDRGAAAEERWNRTAIKARVRNKNDGGCG